jgi:hypothetical protein
VTTSFQERREQGRQRTRLVQELIAHHRQLGIPFHTPTIVEWSDMTASEQQVCLRQLLIQAGRIARTPKKGTTK